ncbi:MAG: hypothetical protein HYX75_07220 [Acidobacteria bacterium]|nr:hypothetical protein [Acidobacteriota bacterium]
MPNVKLRDGAVFLLLCLSPIPRASALDPLRAVTQYTCDVWQPKEGLPQSSVAAIGQTQDGHIWFGTKLGLARFDGLRFTVFAKRNVPALRSNSILALCGDRHGDLWIGTDGGGLVKYRDGRFEAITKESGLSSNKVRAIHEDSAGNLWVGTIGGGLNLVKGREVTVYTLDDGLAGNVVHALASDSHGDLWIATKSGLSRLRNGKFSNYRTAEGLPGTDVRSVYVDRQSVVWVGMFSGGVFRFESGQFAPYVPKPVTPYNSVSCSLQDSDGNFWVGTLGGGLSRLRDGEFETLTMHDGLPDDIIRALFEDAEGNVWIGTDSGGVARLKDEKFTCFSSREGLSHDLALTVIEDRERSLWVGTHGGGLNRLRGGKIEHFTTANGLSSDIILTLGLDPGGELVVGAIGGGLTRFDSGRFLPHVAARYLRDESVSALCWERDGSLWIGTYGSGLGHFDGAALRWYTTADGLPDDTIMAVQEDREGNLWVGTFAGGLTLLRGGRFKTYDTQQGLPDDAVYCFHEDEDAAIWIGTGGGLSRLSNGKLGSITTADGLPDDWVFRILEDRSGDLWLSCSTGIARVPRRELTDFLEGRRRSISPRFFTEVDGLRSAECSGGMQPAGWKTSDGRLCFPTSRGVAIIDPANMKISRTPPPIVIERVSVDGETLESPGPYELSYGKKNFEFDYAGLSYSSPSQVRFKYKLDGLDSDWVDPGTRRTAFYTTLPPGAYCFRVLAGNKDGMWTHEPATFSFEILRPIWATWWVRAAFLLSLLGIAYSFARWRHMATLRREHERMDVLQQITIGLLHELRQPLQAIISQLELLALRTKDNDQKKPIEEISGGAMRMARIFDKLERLQSGGVYRTKEYATHDRMLDLSGKEPRGEPP